MKFMILVKADADSEAGKVPDTRLLTEIGKYNEELVKAGVMLVSNGESGTRLVAGSHAAWRRYNC